MRRTSTEFDINRKKLLAKYKACQECGRTIDLQIHHIIPVIQGGSDKIDNLKVLCSVCHNEEHFKDKSELTKKGIEKARHAPSEALISLLDFYSEVDKHIEAEGIITVYDIFDIVERLPIKTRKKLKN